MVTQIVRLIKLSGSLEKFNHAYPALLSSITPLLLEFAPRSFLLRIDVILLLTGGCHLAWFFFYLTAIYL